MPLGEYRRKRDAAATPEPVPASDDPTVASDGAPIFVVQEHHASALHWDFRLERDGVLVSWALPKGVPDDPARNHLAVHVEDHPLEYATFAGTIGEGQYGGGTVTVWDHGIYEVQTWSEREVKVVLHGERTHGRFALFRTRGKNWMIHRMDAPAHPDWAALPSGIAPMLATSGDVPAGAGWSYEMKWDGVRALVAIEGGRVRLTSRNGNEMGVAYPELRALGLAVGSTQLLLDGEITALDASGRPDFGRLQQRMHVTDAAAARRLATSVPATLLLFDLLHADGRALLDQPYAARRAALEALGLDGPSWSTPPAFTGDGAQALAWSREHGLEGVVAKRDVSRYQPGRRSTDWVKTKNIRAQEVVVGGWRAGQGRRAGTLGSLLLGVPGAAGLVYVGHVGTGFSEAALADLGLRLQALAQETSPFSAALPRADARDAHWVTPELVGEVRFTEWTHDGRLRHPAWRGLRPDKAAADVVRET